MPLRAGGSKRRELSSAEMNVADCSGVFRCLRPLRRCRRVVVQSLMLIALVVGVMILVASHHRTTSTSSVDSLRRFVRSVSDMTYNETETSNLTASNSTVRSTQENSPGSRRVVLGDDGSNGYILLAGVNDSRLTDAEFRFYGDAVDLRLIVLAYDRPESLTACLESLEAAEYDDDDRLALHVWIDGCCTADEKHDSEAHKKTIDVARSFNFSRGSYDVHVRQRHVGVQGQWMTVWRPAESSVDDVTEPEITLILEDDMSVSTFYWRWLRAAHRAYDRRPDVSGYSVSHPEMEHATGSVLEVPVNYTVFMYPIICTWGFSPHPVSWRQFEDWFYEVDANSSFVPLVDGILSTEWFVSERQSGRERTLWEQWHIYYTTARHQYTVMANTGPRAGLLAVNRHEKGLHDGNVVVGATQALCTEWTSRLDNLPLEVVKLGYDGLPLDRNHTIDSNV